MPSFTFKLKQIRWYQWVLATLLLLYIIYIALSYLYLPGKLKQVTESDVATLIGRDISVEKIAFNPFTLSIGIDKLAVADQPEKPLVGWQRLFVNLGFWESIFKWKIALDEFAIDRPVINIEKHPSGMNFSDILERFSAKNAPETADTQPKENAGLALEIGRTTINLGLFSYSDLSGTVPAHSNLNDVTIEVHGLYLATGDLNLNPFDLTAKLPGGGDVQLNGRYRIDPLQVEADIAANGVQLAAFSEFLENVIPISVENGRLSFSTHLLAKIENGFQLQTNQGRLGITGLNIADGTPDPPMLQSESITVEDATLDLGGKSVSVEKVILDGILANQWIDPVGKLRYEALLVKTEQEKADEKAPTPETTDPWEVVIRQIVLQDGTFHFSDQNEATAQRHSLSEISLAVEDFSLPLDEPTAFSLTTLLDETGRIRASGTFVSSPLALSLGYRLEDIRLSDFSKYIETTTHLRIDGGDLFIEGRTSLDKSEGNGTAVALDLSITDFQAVDDRTGDTVLNMEAFDLKNIEVDTDAQTVSIASATLAKPEIFTQMSSEKEMNLATLSKTGGGQSPPADDDGQAETDGPAWNFSLLSTGVENGVVHYTDRSVSPMFNTGIHDLSLEAGPIATDRTDPTPFSITANIDQYAPFSVSGTLLPLDRQPGFSFTSTLEGLEMPGLSPYSVTFIGNNLKSGNLSLSLDYSLKDRKLSGKNNIVAENLHLGEKVHSETAVDAPVALGLALLRDLNGVIDLDVGVAGDLDDPGFSVSGIITKAFINVIVKAATSPFKLLGAIVGSEEELGEVKFSPGISTLTQANEARLRHLSEALTQRPQLALVVHGNASMTEDGNALKAREVLQQAASLRGIPPAELAAGTEEKSWWQLVENREILVSLNDKHGLLPVSERWVAIQEKMPELQDEALATEVYNRIYEDIAALQEIDTAQILALADARALSVKQHLVEVLGFDHERVSTEKTRATGLDGLTLALEIEAM